MKIKRHEKILEIIINNVVDTQEQLLKLLKNEGYQVTQATVSRDIKDMRLIKTLSSDGRYRYTAAPQKAPNDTAARFHSIFKQTALSVDYAGHTVVVKCHTGMANAACAALDLLSFKNIVGTLSGDDTFFILT
ncbi:MAG: arginine repressor, partial [Hydrogenoanaerobacterium sp.]